MKRKLSQENLVINAEFPVYSSGTANGGLVGYTDNPEFICDAQNPVYVIFGDHTRTMNIVKKSFSVLDNVKVLIPFTNNEKVLLFIFSIWKKQIPDLGYSRHWKIAKNCILQLPVKNGKMDFKFMEDFVAKLEMGCMTGLDIYLKTRGFYNCKLSSEEKKALDDYLNSDIKEYNFNLPDIFKVKNTHNILLRDIVEDSGTTPYLCASTENNAVSTYISYDENYLEKGNCIFIGGKTFVVTYQEKDFYSNDSHNLALYLKKSRPVRTNMLYLAACIYKGLSDKYSWGDSVSKTKIKIDKICLPIKNGKPDFKFMKTFISAVQKLVIKDVVMYITQKFMLPK